MVGHEINRRLHFRGLTPTRPIELAAAAAITVAAVAELHLPPDALGALREIAVRASLADLALSDKEIPLAGRPLIAITHAANLSNATILAGTSGFAATATLTGDVVIIPSPGTLLQVRATANLSLCPIGVVAAVQIALTTQHFPNYIDVEAAASIALTTQHFPNIKALAATPLIQLLKHAAPLSGTLAFAATPQLTLASSGQLTMSPAMSATPQFALSVGTVLTNTIGTVWGERTVNHNAYYLHCSTSGQHIIIGALGSLVRSTNYGSTLIYHGSFALVPLVCIARGGGTFMYGQPSSVPNQILNSPFAAATQAPGTYFTPYAYAVARNADRWLISGLSTAFPNPTTPVVYRSSSVTPSFSSWTAESLGIASSCCLSGNGTIGYLVQSAGSPQEKKLFKSTNSGATWVQLSGGGLPADLAAVVCNNDGSIVVVIDYSPNALWVSMDSGANWSQIGTEAGFSCLAMNDSGHVIVFGKASGGKAWISKDFGSTISELTNSPAGNYSAVTMNGQGTAIYATLGTPKLHYSFA